MKMDLKFNALIPELSVQNFERSLRFYTEVLGFKIKYQRPENKFAFLEFEGAQIMLEQYNGNWTTGKLEHPFGRGINFSVKARNLEGFYDKVSAVGHPIFRGLEKYEYRCNDEMLTGKEFLIQDLDGYLLRFCESDN